VGDGVIDFGFAISAGHGTSRFRARDFGLNGEQQRPV